MFNKEAKMLNKDQTRKILEAIRECDRYIAIEEPRNPKLRPEWAQKTLDHYKAHKAKLQNALATGIWAV